MGGAEWVHWVFAGVFAALTIFYLIRIFISEPGTSARGVDVARGVMSLGMVAMMVPQIDLLPRVCWQLLFVMVAGYVTARLIRRWLRTGQLWLAKPSGHHELHLLIGGVAMVYMFAAMSGWQGTGAGVPLDPGAGFAQDMGDMSHGVDMAQTGASGFAFTVLTWLFVGYFLIFVVRLAARLAVPVNTLAGMAAGAALPGQGARGVVVSPHLLGSTEVVMGIGMSCMLLMML
ncbi:MAG: DUF5134 domain-containing protein [Pseudonocardiales bacterium]|nr:DUF5134 domain-containing protein [Pseudonocardiales bacterium]MBV9652189.1 DUF5134 domain-containing protein [Pseudonocardiales bacterium]